MPRITDHQRPKPAFRIFGVRRFIAAFRIFGMRQFIAAFRDETDIAFSAPKGRGSPSPWQRPVDVSATSPIRRPNGPMVRLLPILCALTLFAEMTSWAWSADTTEGKGELVFLCPNIQRQGVKLEIDGVLTPVPETGPWQTGCQPGSHRISAKRPGHFPIEQTVEIYEGQNITVALMWQALPAGMTLEKLAAATAAGKPKPPDGAATAAPKAQEQPGLAPGQSSGEANQDAQSVESQKPEKLPVPSSIAQGDMIRLVDEAYKIDDAKTSAEKVSLGKKLASLAGASQKPEERFVLFRRAAELARDAGHLPMMCQSIEAMGTSFDMDTLMVQARMFDRYASDAASPLAVSTGLDGAKELINRALAEDRYDVASHVIDSASRLCEQSSGPRDREEFEQRRAEIERLREQWQQVCAAMGRLKTTPNDPKANFIVGRWVLLQKGDAKQGLAYLAKGSDSSFRRLAQQELAAEPTRGLSQFSRQLPSPDAKEPSLDAKMGLSPSPAEVEPLAKVADAWWDLAQLQADEGKEQLFRHAGQLYMIVLPKLSDGLQKSLVERRLEELASPKRTEAETVSQESGKASSEVLKPGKALPLGRPVDLLPLVDLKRDSVLGFWEREGESLVTTQPKKNSTVLLPAIVEGDYRLETQFTRTAGEDAVAMIVWVGGNPCLLTFSELSGKVSRLGVDSKASRAIRKAKSVWSRAFLLTTGSTRSQSWSGCEAMWLPSRCLSTASPISTGRGIRRHSPPQAGLHCPPSNLLWEPTSRWRSTAFACGRSPARPHCSSLRAKGNRP